MTLAPELPGSSIRCEAAHAAMKEGRGILFILAWDCIGLVVVAATANHAAVGCPLAPTRGVDRPWRLSAIGADRTGRLSNR